MIYVLRRMNSQNNRIVIRLMNSMIDLDVLIDKELMNMYTDYFLVLKFYRTGTMSHTNNF